jgi:hypothetical protein
MIKVCPNCNSRYPVKETDVDFAHTCDSGDTSLDEEDVFVVGNWTDGADSGTVKNPMMQGSANRLYGSRAWIDGERVHDVTERGNNASDHRQKQHVEFINLREDKKVI